MSIVIFGSINMDLVVQSPRLPRPGETLTGNAFRTVPGGKGANQAVACARLGVPTTLIGCVGDDAFGPGLLESLRGYGVDTSHIATIPGESSGIAVITVDDRAENTIIVVQGANGLLGPDNLSRLQHALPTANCLLLQLEVPLASVIAAAKIAHDMGKTVILDPAPAQPLPAELYPLVDILTPNQTEAEALVGYPIVSMDDARRAAIVLLERGVRGVVIKMGVHGAYWTDGAHAFTAPAFPVSPVDTVAAGDAFNGALAAALDQQLPTTTALQWACAAGALCVTRPGAQSAMPDRAELQQLIQNRES
jgi:ribokinase